MKNLGISISLMSLAIVGCLALAAAGQQAQTGNQSGNQAENPLKAKKYDNATWHEVRMLRFKPGKFGDAMKIVNDYYIPADQSAGLGPHVRYEDAVGGNWNLITIVEMAGGAADLEWDVHPDGEKWMNALAKHCGGMDKAVAIRKSFQDMIEDRDSQVFVSRGGNVAAK